MFLIFLFLMGVFLQPVLLVMAGNINGNEQSVLSYVSGAVFEYQGESYVAKEEYINQLRTKFMQDDIDLTQKEANNAIMQINANVKTGVTDGYLRKVSGTSGQVAVAPTDKSEVTKTPTEETKVTETPADKTELTDSDGKTGEEAAAPIKEGNKPENEPAQETSADIIRRIDTDAFVQEVLSQDTEAVKLSVEQDKKNGSSIVAVEQYLPGEMTVVSSKGEILFQGSLPIKNTGYETKKNAIFVFIIFYCGFLMIITSKRMCGSKNET